jgi:hypothetical protein
MHNKETMSACFHLQNYLTELDEIWYEQTTEKLFGGM